MASLVTNRTVDPSRPVNKFLGKTFAKDITDVAIIVSNGPLLDPLKGAPIDEKLLIGALKIDEREAPKAVAEHGLLEAKLATARKC